MCLYRARQKFYKNVENVRPTITRLSSRDDEDLVMSFLSPISLKHVSIKYSPTFLEENINFMKTSNFMGLMVLSRNVPSPEEFGKVIDLDVPPIVHKLAYFVMKLIPLSILAIQFFLFFLLFWYQYENSNGFCPNRQGIVEKLTITIIAIFYSVQLWNNAFTHYLRNSIKWQSCTITEEDRVRTKSMILNACGLPGWEFDLFYNLIFDKFILVLNMWVVFNSENSLNMILNSLAINFIAQLDEEYKETALAVNPLYRRYLVDCELAYGMCRQDNDYPYEMVVGQISLVILSPLIMMGATIYLGFCV